MNSDPGDDSDKLGQPAKRPDDLVDDDFDAFNAKEDALIVIRAWREAGSGPEDGKWRGQVSHGTSTEKFIGFRMLFDHVMTVLQAVAVRGSPEDHR